LKIIKIVFRDENKKAYKTYKEYFNTSTEPIVDEIEIHVK